MLVESLRWTASTDKKAKLENELGVLHSIILHGKLG